MEPLFCDLRYAIRSMLRGGAPSSAIIVMTLALAMGTSAVIFTVITTVRRSVPAEDQGRVAHLLSTDSGRGRDRSLTSASDFLDWKEQNQSFDALGALAFGTFNLTGVETPARLVAARASADLFRVLDLEPVVGRIFRGDEDRPGGDHIVLLANRFWRGQFDANPAVLGRTLRLDGERYSIIGVLPSRVDVGAFRQVDVWVPLAVDAATSPRDRRTLRVFGRLKAGTTREQSGAEMASIAHRLELTYPATNSGIGVKVEPIIEAFGGGGVRVLLTLMMLMAVSLVAIACANVVNVMLARAAGRRRELAVRTAIGASRSRIVRQLMIEDLLLSLAGGAVGLVLCAWEVDAVKAVAGRDMAIFSDLTVDAPVVLFALAVAIVAPIVFGLLPAMRSSAVEIRDGLKEGASSITAGPRGRQVRETLVACQAALALALLVEVAVLVRTTVALSHVEKGFDPRQLLTLRVDLPASAYGEPDRVRQFYHALMRRLEGLPGVESAGAIDRRPITDRETPVRFAIEGQPPARPDTQPWAALASITPAYRRTMRVPLVKGRDLTSDDSEGARSEALVSRLAALRYWPDGDALGKRIRLATPDADPRWLEIVGVVGDVRNSDAAAGLVPQIYIPHSRAAARTMSVMVRSAGDPSALTPAIRSAVSQIDRDLPIYDVATMDQVLFDDLASTYVLAGMIVALAVIALALATSGIYGVVAYSVSQRTHEIGIRMALGAQASAVLALVVKQGLLAVFVGGLAGLAGGIGLARITAGALGEVNAFDPAAYAGVVACLALAALLASYLPARRATRIDPVAALRAE